MKRLLSLGMLLGLLGLLFIPAASRSADLKPKEALQALGEFIGTWNGTGGPDKTKPGPKDPFWKETLNWGWKFKGDDAWLILEIKTGKYLKSGEMRYLPEKKVYQLTLADKDGNKQVYDGQLKNDVLLLHRTDAATKEEHTIEMSTNNDGARFVYRAAHKKPGALLVKDYMVAGTKDGESLAAREKKNLCVVSGGIGTTTVSYKGETFYVCCSGCAEAFRENPEKYIAEFKAKKK